MTGAGKGIGKEIARTLVEQGAQVIAVSRTRSDLDELEKEIGCETICCDLSDAEAARDVAERSEGIDLLVNNAGISIPQSFLGTSVENLQATLATNLVAVMVISQVIARRMMKCGIGGAIVNISSQASIIGLTDHAAYCASKGALDQLTRVMALELGAHRIRVNCVNPTVTLTPMAEMAWSDPARSEPMLKRIPLGRFASPSDVADTVAFLLSEEASMITGTMVPVDGGFLSC